MNGNFVRIAQSGHTAGSVVKIDGAEYSHDQLRRALNAHSDTFPSSRPSVMMQPGLPYGHRPTDKHLTTVNMVEYLVNELDDVEIHECLEQVRDC